MAKAPEKKKLEPIDLTTVLTKEHDGKWVVLSEDNKKVIACADSVEEIKEFIGKGVLMKVHLGAHI